MMRKPEWIKIEGCFSCTPNPEAFCSLLKTLKENEPTTFVLVCECGAISVMEIKAIRIV